MASPIWLLKEVVTAVHQRQLAEHGGRGGMREDSLEAALARPQQLYSYLQPKPTPAALAASYMFSISAMHHPFTDGNKRVGYVCGRLFLKLNGRDLIVPPEVSYPTMIALAAGEMTEDALVAWVQHHLIYPK